MSIDRSKAEQIVNQIPDIKVGDFACGSGTLLTASYSALMRLATQLKYYHDLDVNLEELGKKLIEEGIYGIDALKYASQITAINLALMGPPVSKENIYTIYLGYIPGRGPWLGSLELLGNTRKIGGILAYIERGSKVEKVTLEDTEATFDIPEKLDIIIMNPPFTRATGRTESFGEGRGLFGFIIDESSREYLRKSYEELRDRVRNELLLIARELVNVSPVARAIMTSSDLKQYLAIGQAGEGLLFLHLAYKYVKDHGVIAFVLPRGLLAGVSWFLARALLASKFHLKYVIVSSDSVNGYNFSEGTSLSETLIVARRVDVHRDDEDTVFVILLRKPK